MAGHDRATDLFLDLTPERVLDAVEVAGLRCNPICYPLNSFENRVYEIELEDETRMVAKFYRPGRWTEAQIREEHQFLADLAEDEIPVVPVRPFPDGDTLHEIDGIYYCLFDRFGGRAPDEISAEHAERLGMMLARIHNTGERRRASERIRLVPDEYAREDLAFLLANDIVPSHLRERYRRAASAICDIADQRLRGVPLQRIHGDFHLGNLLLRPDTPREHPNQTTMSTGIFHALDFDDFMVGPPVQDVWLLLPGRDAYTRRIREVFLEAYEQLRTFDRRTLPLVEPLRGLRLVHYAAWLARRWHDPVFPQTWPHFGTEAYWTQETADLEDLLAYIHKEEAEAEALAAGREPGTAGGDGQEELTNKDFFWDWEEK
jgi:Ser/Thr protein kinase RdoA (MazF antagonist)